MQGGASSIASNRISYVFNFKGLDSLSGKEIGVVRDYGYSEEFGNAQNFERIEANSFINNINKLVFKRIDLTLEDEIVARTLLNNEAPDLLREIEFSDNTLINNPLHVATEIGRSKSNRIIKAFNAGLKEITKSGELEDIFKRYGLGVSY